MKNKSTLIIVGMFIVCVFTGVVVYNLASDDNDSYFLKVQDEMKDKIESIDIEDNILTINTTSNVKRYCVKTTVSTPNSNNICWKDIENNKATMSVYSKIKYYIWIEDINGVVSSPISINTDK